MFCFFQRSCQHFAVSGGLSLSEPVQSFLCSLLVGGFDQENKHNKHTNTSSFWCATSITGKMLLAGDAESKFGDKTDQGGRRCILIFWLDANLCWNTILCPRMSDYTWTRTPINAPTIARKIHLDLQGSQGESSHRVSSPSIGPRQLLVRSSYPRLAVTCRSQWSRCSPTCRWLPGAWRQLWITTTAVRVELLLPSGHGDQASDPEKLIILAEFSACWKICPPRLLLPISLQSSKAL